MTDGMQVHIYRDGEPAEIRTLSMPTLGLWPYVLLELRPASDGSGDPAIVADAGGGAEEDVAMLPVAFLTSLPFARNPISQELARLRGQIEGRSFSPEYVMEMVAEALGVPMSEEEE